MSAIIRRAINFVRREVLRDSFLLEVKRWVSDNGDATLRLEYPLCKNSVVWDIGGYHGDFAAQIHQKYGCLVDVFEPVPIFHKMCLSRFSGNENIRCLKFGLSEKAGWFEISDDEDASSFVRGSAGVNGHRAELRPVTSMFDELGVSRVDLLKINIEGGEFDVLPALIDSGLVERVRFLQIQFHNFIPGAKQKRDAIRGGLNKTHTEMWNYPFVWESWVIRKENWEACD